MDFTKNKTLAHISLIALLAFGAMSFSFWNGITSGNDLFQHYQFAVTVYDSVKSGELYPSFAATMNKGFGDVALRFYPPLGYYALAGFYFVLHDWYIASQIVFFLIFFVGGVGIYFWAREEFSPEPSLLASGLFIFAPFHLNEIYNNFLFAEFSASAFIPFCFLFVTRVVRKGRIIDAVGLAVAYALLILTHLPLTVVTSIALPIYAVLLIERAAIWKSLANLTAGAASGLVLSSFYWSRMVTEMAWVKHSAESYSSSIWGYKVNFLFDPQNLLNFQDDARNLWFADLMLFSMIAISLPTVVYLIKRRSGQTRFVWAAAATMLFAILMTTRVTEPIWEHVSFLQKVQFPWRWMGVISAFGAVVASIGIYESSKALKESKNILLPIGLGLSLLVFAFTSAFVVKGAVFNPRDEFNRRIESSRGNLSFDGWWPIWTKAAAFRQTDKVQADGRVARIEQWTATEKKFNVVAGDSVTGEVAALYYPHWRAKLNGQPVEVTPNESGLISLPLPADAVNVELTFEEPWFIVVAFWASRLAWLVVAVLITFTVARHKRREITRQLSNV